jgi:polygalacturonase
MLSGSRFKVITITALCFANVALAQDTRKVTEPKVPGSCVILKALLTAKDGELPQDAEAALDTSRLQEAIDRCPAGKAVELSANGAKNSFLSGPFKIKGGVTLLVDGGVTLFASRNARDYDVTPQACGKDDDSGRGCRPFISIDAPDTAIMGDGIIDGRGGAKVLGQTESWWELARRAQKENSRQNVPRLIIATKADNLVFYRITLRNSPNFHASVNKTNGFTAWGVKIDTPATARNTDGIDPSGSTNITITNSYIRGGDDNVAIKAGGAGATTNVTISHNHFYSGHGMSIGSETFAGVNNVLVTDLTMDGTTSGIRIKSDSKRGGLVRDVTYENVCLRDIKFPIAIDPYYEHNREPGPRVPTYRGIVLRGVHSITPGKISMIATDADHSSMIQLDGVEIDGVSNSDISAEYGLIVMGPGKTNIAPEGKGVTTKVSEGTATAVPDCKDRFVPFPALD